MGKRVVVAVDMHAASQASVFYAIHLAGRINTSLALVAISTDASGSKGGDTPALYQDIEMGKHLWLGRAVTESQKQGVTLEVFFTSGAFFDVVLRFVRSQPRVQFIVMDARCARSGDGASGFNSSLTHLHEEFEGEILLVEKAGEITRVSDHYLQSSVTETLS
jgi:hypothetical protein